MVSAYFGERMGEQIDIATIRPKNSLQPSLPRKADRRRHTTHPIHFGGMFGESYFRQIYQRVGILRAMPFVFVLIATLLEHIGAKVSLIFAWLG